MVLNKKAAPWLRSAIAVCAAVVIVLGSTTPATAAESQTVAAPGSGYCVISMPYYWLSGTSGTQINWSGQNACSMALPSQRVNNEIRRQNGFYFWEWITFDSCSSGWVYSAAIASCGRVSTTVQEWSRDHEIKVNYWMETPSGQTWTETGGPVVSGSFTTPHFKY